MYIFHDIPKNNELHDSILNRNRERCFELIQSMDEKQLNARSLGNTPLLLALKTGLIDVAAELINSDKVDSEDLILNDLKGFSALHYACFLREDDLIRLIIEKSGTAKQMEDIFEDWVPPSLTSRKRLIEYCHPSMLYQKGAFGLIPDEIIDAPGFCIFPSLVLTNLIFHIDRLCINYGISEEEDFDEANRMIRDANRFAAIGKIGMKRFLEFRNDKPVNEEICQLLETIEHQSRPTAPPP